MRALLLVHSAEFPINRYSDVLKGQPIEPKAVHSLADLDLGEGSAAVVLVDQILSPNGEVPSFGDSLVVTIGVDGGDTDNWDLDLPAEPSEGVFGASMRGAVRLLRERIRNDDLRKQLRDRTRELKEVNKIGMALSTLRDHEALIRMILSKSRELSRADAGSLYLLDDVPGMGKVLRWKLAQGDSIPVVDFEEQVLPITKKSLAGYVALTGETLVIDDAYELGENVEYSINRSFDLSTGYRTKSVVVLPMSNHKGETIGVVQLINRRRPGVEAKLSADNVNEHVMPFDEETIGVVRSLAGQAAVAVENNILYDSIERLFEGFVTASVTAIEQRDPTTSGHSFRVADLTVELAKTADRAGDGIFAAVEFSHEQIREIRYASLLHDFGKVGVREKVLVKEKKLYPLELDLIRARFDYLTKAAEAEAMRRKLDRLASDGIAEFERFAADTDGELTALLEKLDADFRLVSHANEPTVLPEGEFQDLQRLARVEFVDARGEKQLLLKPDEVKVLSIRKGSLDESERREIESHVTHTFQFLSKIPWTKDLVRVPDYAYAHHEKLNGRGYPRRLPADQIPLQSRMMTVSDIYDALTANDRPYKRAITTERALDILNMEMRDGMLDPAVVALFIEAKVYEEVGISR